MQIEENISLSTQARRWVFTINNPLGEDIEEVDIEKTNLPVKLDYYDLAIIKELEESGCFKFKYVKVAVKVDDFEYKDFVVKRPFFIDIDTAIQYLQSLEHFKYCIFQLEKGEEEQTPHFQGFISFTIGKRFKTIKNQLPFAHIEKAKGSNTQCREYCSKSETRVKGPFEFGKFAEERERTDIKDFIELVRAGATEDELMHLYPTLYLREINKIQAIYALNFKKYKTICRNINVTYIYGSSGVGKTSAVRNMLGLEKSFWVHHYDNAMFTNYNFQDNLVFDEFSGKIPITQFNMMLNVEPIELRGLNCVKYGAYHNVYIISNYSPKELYKETQKTEPLIYQTFNRRLNTIIRVDKDGKWIYERKTEWEDNDNEVEIKLGLDKRTSRVYEYDKHGNKILIFDRHRKQKELTPIETKTPFDEDIIDSDGEIKF